MSKVRILIIGVTGSGKGKVAFELARRIGGEVLSVDSMKVYRRMDIGTAKPPRQVREQVNYHLIDVVEPSETFSVGRFVELAGRAIEQIQGRDKPVVAVGGTALYIKALLYGLFEGPGSDQQIRAELKKQAEDEGLKKLYDQLRAVDPAAAERIHPNDEKRIIRALEVYKLTGKPISALQQQWQAEPAEDWTVIGLRRKKELESRRINARVKKMFEQGLVEEVQSLLAEPEPLSEQARCAIGYAEVIEHLAGKITLEEAVELIKKNTRRLAKSQRTWFKTFTNLTWLDVSESDDPANLADRICSAAGL